MKAIIYGVSLFGQGVKGYFVHKWGVSPFLNFDLFSVLGYSISHA